MAVWKLTNIIIQKLFKSCELNHDHFIRSPTHYYAVHLESGISLAACSLRPLKRLQMSVKKARSLTQLVSSKGLTRYPFRSKEKYDLF
jgi:hypothetical protein